MKIEERKDIKTYLTEEEVRQRYGVALTGNYQVIKHIFYDTALYTSGAAGTLQLDFFNTSRGAANINKVLTNFYESGMLPKNEAFLITHVAFGTEWSVSVNTADASAASTFRDIQSLKWHSTAEFNFVHKVYGPIASMVIPQGPGPVGSVANLTTVAAAVAFFSVATNGTPHASNLYPVRYLVEGNNQFYIRQRWDAPQTLIGQGTAGTHNTFIRWYLYGFWFRPVG
jgi:hypothetical protein